ncbi:hypothetical protein [Streptomyces sp. LMG1-1-1.1]|uniref:hypothetical protein n=1 Tax=Streptomyces sp. LMG1-1-1.1 TaxID=3135245 RepID=UPI003467ACE8
MDEVSHEQHDADEEQEEKPVDDGTDGAETSLAVEAGSATRRAVIGGSILCVAAARRTATVMGVLVM